MTGKHTKPNNYTNEETNKRATNHHELQFYMNSTFTGRTGSEWRDSSHFMVFLSYQYTIFDFQWMGNLQFAIIEWQICGAKDEKKKGKTERQDMLDMFC